MQTAIGQRLNSSPTGLITASAAGSLIVAADMVLVAWDHYPVTIEGRGVLAAIALGVQVRVVRGDLDSVGLRLTPVQGWYYWGRVALLIGLAILALILLTAGAWVVVGRELPVYTTPPRYLGIRFLQMCLFAPVQEELIYRLALCVPLVVLLGPWRTIAVSGLAFAGLHFVYGNPSPENVLGGFFLAWAYLKSESIAVPILLHSLGNLFALACQVGTWYWLGGVS